MKRELVIPQSLANERVDRAVALLTSETRASAAALIKSGAISLQGTPILNAHRRVLAGELLRLELMESVVHPSTPLSPNNDVSFEVCHVDEDIIVVNKPSGVVVHPGAGHEQDTLAAGLLARFPDLAQLEMVGGEGRPGIVHRLDKDTSGLLVIARTPKAYAELVAQLQRREVTRIYWTLVCGELSAANGTIEAPIGRSARNRTLMAVAAGGKPARTHYRVIDRPSSVIPTTLLEVTLDTGRTHQIRVHLAAIGHPVVGDGRYKGTRRELDLPRPFLHARELRLIHPRSGDQMTFRADLPNDLMEFLAPITTAAAPDVIKEMLAKAKR